MLISVRHRFVFIANTKTASTSIEAALTPYCEINRVGTPERKHVRWADARREYSFLFDQPDFGPESFLRFGVVRDPVDWVLSWFNYRTGNKGLRDPLPREMTFDQFWASNDWVKDLSQKTNFVDQDGICRFDCILLQEDLGRIFPALSRRLVGKALPLPKENASAVRRESRDSLQPELEERIREHFAQDLAFYMEWRERAARLMAQLDARGPLSA